MTKSRLMTVVTLLLTVLASCPCHATIYSPKLTVSTQSQATILNGIRSGGGSQGSIQPSPSTDVAPGDMGDSLQVNWPTAPPNGGIWDIYQNLPPGTDMSQYDTFSCEIFSNDADPSTTLTILLEDPTVNTYRVGQINLYNTYQSNIGSWVWTNLSNNESTITQPQNEGNYAGGYNYVAQNPNWNNINKVLFELYTTSSTPYCNFEIDSVTFSSSHGGTPLHIFNTGNDGILAPSGWSEPMHPITQNGLIILPGVASSYVGGIANAQSWDTLFGGNLGTTTDDAATARAVAAAGIPVAEYDQYADKYFKYLTNNNSWDVNWAPNATGGVSLSFGTNTLFGGNAILPTPTTFTAADNWLNSSGEMGPALQCQSYASAGTTSAGTNRIDALTSMGIGNWIMADYVFPSTQPINYDPCKSKPMYGPWGYSHDNIVAYASDLAGTDSGLVERASGQPTTVRFNDYFKAYNGFDCNYSYLQAIQSNLNSDFSNYYPPGSAENGDIEPTNAWGVFEYLRSYEWLKLADRTGRYQQSKGGQGVWIMPNQENTVGSSDYFYSIASGGVCNFLPEDFGNPENILEAGYAGFPALREQAEKGTVGAMTTTGSGDIYTTPDVFHYTYQTLSGDGTIVARVTSLGNTSTYAKAGVMLRNSLDSSDVFVATIITEGNSAYCEFRADRAAEHCSIVPAYINNNSNDIITVPYWVKLQRSGDTFTSYVSPTNAPGTWQEAGSATITMNQTLFVGFATAASGDSDTTATYDNISITDSSNRTTGVQFASGAETDDTPLASIDTVASSSNVAGYYSCITPELFPAAEQVHTGASSFLYSGSSTSSTANCYCTYNAFPVNFTIQPTTKLSYWIFPQQDNGRYVGVDIQFSDGSWLRDTGALDQYNHRLHPIDGHGGNIPLNAWTQIKSDIGKYSSGKVATEICLVYNRYYSPASQYRGFIDDIQITNSLNPWTDSDIGNVVTPGSSTQDTPGMLSMDMETGENGHDAPYWDPQIAYMTAYSLAAASQADDIDNDFMDESPYSYQLNPPNGSNQRLRYNDCAAKGKGFLQARSEQAKRDIALILNVTTRPPARMATGVTNSVAQDYSFGLPISRAHLMFDQRDILDLGVVENRYNMIAYAPLIPRVGDMSMLSTWVQSQPSRVLLTHTFVPTRDATYKSTTDDTTTIEYPNGVTGNSLGTIQSAMTTDNDDTYSISYVDPSWQPYISVGQPFTIPAGSFFTICSSGTPVVKATHYVNGQPVEVTLVTQVTFNVGSGTSRIVYCNFTNMAPQGLVPLEAEIVTACAGFSGIQPVCTTSDTSTIVQVYNVPGGQSVCAWDAGPLENTSDWTQYPLKSNITNATTGDRKVISIHESGPGPYTGYELAANGGPYQNIYPNSDGYIVLPALTTVGDIYYIVSEIWGTARSQTLRTPVVG